MLNIGTPQGDSIREPLFTIYFEHALKGLKEDISKEPIDVRDITPKWIERAKSSLPKYMQYADNCDFLTEDLREKEIIYTEAKEIL